MSYTNGIGGTQNRFATETTAANGPAQAERTASVSLTNPAAMGSSLLPSTDQAKVSGFGGALAQALSESDVRMDKVTALQQAIAAGTYAVSAQDVAEEMIGAMLG